MATAVPSFQQTLDYALQHYNRREFAQAEQLCRQCLKLQPNDPQALHLLGLLAGQAGQLAAGAELIQRAIGVNPKEVAYYVNLGTLLEPLGRLDEAEAAYRQAIRLRPDLPEAHNNLGNVLFAKGQSAPAIDSFREALRLRPDYPDALFNLGNSLHELGQRDEAIAAYRRSITLRPQWLPAYHNLADTFHSQGNVDDCIEWIHRALQIHPAEVFSLTKLGNAYKDRGQIKEAIECYERALAIDPNYEPADASRVYTLSLHPDYDSQAILRELRVWEQRHADRVPKDQYSHKNNPSPNRRLRIGYVSADFRNHVIARNIFPLLRDRDRQQFEVFCYSNLAHGDQMTEKLRTQADCWQEIARMNDQQAANLIVADGIDILVDLSLHTPGNRLLVFAQKPAPIQLTYAGYPGGTGLRSMDWRLTDTNLDPPGFEDDYVEQSYRLPDSFWCYDPEIMQWNPGAAAPPEVGPLPATGNGFVTFGCLNTFAKINQDVLNLWAHVLAAVENSRLLVMAPPGDCRRRVIDALALHNISADRAEFITYQPRAAYLNQFNRIDLALDTFPYNGHTASLDAMWMGVPVVSRVGRTVVGRAGLSQLSNLGLTELAAHDDEQFIRIAAEWAGNLSRLAQLRQTLRRRMLDSPLTDGPRFARNIESAFRTIWKIWCQTTAARPIERPSPDEHFNRGNALGAAKRFAEALVEYQHAITLKPNFAEAHNNLGNSMFQLGRLDDSIAEFRQALTLKPDYADAHNNLGNALYCLGQSGEAVVAFERALALRPNSPETHNNRGNALSARGRFEEAIASYRRALVLRPAWPEVLNNLSGALRSSGNLQAAIDICNQILTQCPDDPLALNNLGAAQFASEQPDRAIATFNRVLALCPEDATAHNNIGNIFRAIGRTGEAIESYKRASDLSSAGAAFASNRLFALQFHHGIDAPTLLAEHKRWDQQYAQPLRASIHLHENDRSRDRRLRIGYLSPDFRSHCQSLFTTPLLKHHDHSAFEIICYADVIRPDAVTGKLRANADGWRSIVGMTDLAVADLIRSDRVDILIDLTMHMANGRPLVMARKPAPVQAAWLAYPGTTGISTIDYRLTDPYLDPPDQNDDCYSEQSHRLPDTFWCYDPLGMELTGSPDAEALPAAGALPALQSGYVTFGCLNDFSKINDMTLERWSRVLQAIPRSRLLLLAPRGETRTRVLEKIASHGLDTNRVEFVARQPRRAYLAEFNRIDICLDTLPYNGHTTSLDSYWMGVPVVTLVGSTVVGRAGWSQLSNMGLMELAARDDQQFVQIALRWANDLSQLAELRRTLRDRMLASPLTRANRFASNMESAYREMWSRYCRESA